MSLEPKKHKTEPYGPHTKYTKCQWYSKQVRNMRKKSKKLRKEFRKGHSHSRKKLFIFITYLYLNYN